METIVVGLDGDKGSEAAAMWAAAQAKSRDAHVIAVHVVPRSGLWSLSAFQVDIDKVMVELRELLDGTWCGPLRNAEVEHSTQLVRGDPAQELIRAATRAEASMLVLGSKNHSGLADLVVGGTVHKIINRTTLPVVLVPASPPAKKAAATKKTK